VEGGDSRRYQEAMKKKPNYGIDSPGMVAGQFILSLIAFAIAAANPHFLGFPARWPGLSAGVYFLSAAAGMLHYSKIGKLKLRDRLLNQIQWRGDESLLDLGCGRGLLLVGAARHLTTGKAVGVDIWLPRAVSGNREASAIENAAAEGVAARVELRNADIRQLPFPDASFDIALSNFVLHEMNTAADRAKMLTEILRVLKPGGRLLLIDFIFTGECVATLKREGADADRTPVGRASYWIPAILYPGIFQLCQVTATKPISGQFSEGFSA
jgi:arsenite methyltransferase